MKTTFYIRIIFFFTNTRLCFSQIRTLIEESNHLQVTVFLLVQPKALAFGDESLDGLNMSHGRSIRVWNPILVI